MIRGDSCSEESFGWEAWQVSLLVASNVRLKFKQNWGYKKWYNHELVLVVLVEQQFGC
jgi:hypothetical protein